MRSVGSFHSPANAAYSLLMRADLHIHSCLSPCALLEMSPRAIAHWARTAGLDLIALTDHNTARNAPAFAEACRDEEVRALFGVEVNTAEEAHVLCLFDDPHRARAFGDEMYARLPPIVCRPEWMGDQPVVDADGDIVEMLDIWLGGATNLPLTDLCAMARKAGALCIPSHIDRPRMSLCSQLGRVPDLPYDAVEVSRPYREAEDPARVRGRYAMLRSSDAHALDDLGRGWTELDTDDASLPSLRAAFKRLRERQARAG